MNKKHSIPVGTKVSLLGKGTYEVMSEELYQCDDYCAIPHESCCFQEPHIPLRKDGFFVGNGYDESDKVLHCINLELFKDVKVLDSLCK